jgi:primary-amine oxidase
MSTEQALASLPLVGRKEVAVQHPLGPLTASEISKSSRLIKSIWPSNTNIQFKSITLQEPNKAELIPFLAAEHAGDSPPTIERRSFVVYYIRNTVSICNFHSMYWLSDIGIPGQTPRSYCELEPRKGGE